MPTWDLFVRMLNTPHADLDNIRKAITSRYTDHESSEVESVLEQWTAEKLKDKPTKWLEEQDYD